MKQGTLPVLKLYDFGLSKDKRDDSSPRTQIGTALFTSPEVFLNMDGQSYEGDAVDVWSCGVILYALLCGSLPFDDESIANLFKKIKGGIYNLPSHLSPGRV